MTGIPSASVTLYVNVWDEQIMWQSAFAVYEKTSGTADQPDFELMCGTQHKPDICACPDDLRSGRQPDGRPERGLLRRADRE